MRPVVWTTLLAAGTLAPALWLGLRHAEAPKPPEAAQAPGVVAPMAGPPDAGRADRGASRSLRLPSGAPAALTCRDARRVIAQARSHLASPPPPVDPAALAEATVDWLDPHGLWSASPDAPLGGLLRRRAAELALELEASRDSTPCAVAEEAGGVLAAWIARLAPAFEAELEHAEAIAPADAWQLAADPVFEDRAVARPAVELAGDLGHRAGVVLRTLGEPLRPFVDAARERYLPPLGGAAWTRIVLAAAVRAYVPQIDPHGGWAPLDEETSLYEVELEASPPRRLWDRMVRTALGVRVESGAQEPIADHDLVLEVSTVPAAGLSVDQLEQLAVQDDLEETSPRPVVVLRRGEGAPRALEIPVLDRDPDADPAAPLESERLEFGDVDALVVAVRDVPDDLGDLLASTLAKARAAGPVGAVVLDLRGNGGGSTDGANAALGLFMPGVPLFPMRRRDGAVETERAPTPPETDRFAGPVAALVDGDTASAAEMIAGALASYRRGPVVGSRTYGKGCAQEYLDDESKGGVLRLTTLVYALPDGAPVQRVGLLPTLHLSTGAFDERESRLAHALPTWRGPDVRDPSKIGDVPWPLHHGRVGPCKDDVVCRALRALGDRAAFRGRGGVGARRPKPGAGALGIASPQPVDPPPQP